MRSALNNLNADLVQHHPDYVVRVTSEEGRSARHLSDFQDPEKPMPVIVTTSKLLTTGVDVPTCKNVVLARVINSMTEFKQIIGRGTRVDADYGKYFFNILDYTGSAIARFADPAFDGEPLPPRGKGGKKAGREAAERMDPTTQILRRWRARGDRCLHGLRTGPQRAAPQRDALRGLRR